tara:strand:- start:9691 stop:9813 length:123 start_codon:yes stop_codon:yes gene_type:complete
MIGLELFRIFGIKAQLFDNRIFWTTKGHKSLFQKGELYDT